jgi:hypothetical protein
MNKSKDSRSKKWKTNWLGEYGGTNKLFTLTTLKGFVIFLGLACYSVARSAATFCLLMIVYSYFNPGSFDEFISRVSSPEITDILLMLWVAMLWHSLMVKIFTDWRRWKARRRNPLG